MKQSYRGPSIGIDTSCTILPSGFRGEDFQKSTNQKKELHMATMFVNGSG
jgi:hypothetical protein